jgi:hypothetical protein
MCNLLLRDRGLLLQLEGLSFPGPQNINKRLALVSPGCIEIACRVF